MRMSVHTSPPTHIHIHLFMCVFVCVCLCVCLYTQPSLVDSLKKNKVFVQNNCQAVLPLFRQASLLLIATNSC